MAIISPRRQDVDTTQLINMFGTGIDRFMKGQRQREEDELARQQAGQLGQIRGLQIKEGEQKVKAGEELAGLESKFIQSFDKPLDPTLPEGTQGPQRSPEFLAKSQADIANEQKSLIQKILVKRGRAAEAFEVGKKDDVDPDMLALEKRGKKAEVELKEFKVKELEKELNDLALGKKPVDEKVFGIEDKLRSAFVKASSDFIKQRDAFGRVQASATDPSPAGDLALIFNFMKVLDPGSTVREGEFANAQNTGSVPTQIWAQYNKIRTGERLTSKQRQDFLSQTENLFGSANQQHQKRVGETKRLAEAYASIGVDPSRVLIDLNIVPKKTNQTETAQPEQQMVGPLSFENMSDDELDSLLMQGLQGSK